MAMHWPVEHGGTGWSPIQKHIFEEECAEYGAPTVLPFGVNMVAPVIIKFGTEEQKQTYLPKILNSDVWWCQGYSEPGAGSDLAGLKTKAVREGDHYIVNGQKTWTTLVSMSWIFYGAHRPERQEAGRYFLPADRHGNTRNHRASADHPGWRTRSERSVLRR